MGAAVLTGKPSNDDHVGRQHFADIIACQAAHCRQGIADLRCCNIKLLDYSVSMRSMAFAFLVAPVALQFLIQLSLLR
jgi:hypothetical protein